MIATRENARENLRVQRLHAAVHHLGKARVLGDIADGNALAFQVFAGSAGAENLHAGGDKPSGEIGKPQLIAHADQGTLNTRRSHEAVSSEWQPFTA